MMASTSCSLMMVDTKFWSPVSPTTRGTPAATAQSNPVESSRKIVEHDDALAGRDERVDHMAADVAGAAGDQDRHVCCPLLVVRPITTGIR